MPTTPACAGVCPGEKLLGILKERVGMTQLSSGMGPAPTAGRFGAVMHRSGIPSWKRFDAGA